MNKHVRSLKFRRFKCSIFQTFFVSSVFYHSWRIGNRCPHRRWLDTYVCRIAPMIWNFLHTSGTSNKFESYEMWTTISICTAGASKCVLTELRPCALETCAPASQSNPLAVDNSHRKCTAHLGHPMYGSHLYDKPSAADSLSLLGRAVDAGIGSWKLKICNDLCWVIVNLQFLIRIINTYHTIYIIFIRLFIRERCNAF